MTATAEAPVEAKTTEQLVAEHERMILDLQKTIADMAQGKIGTLEFDVRMADKTRAELKEAEYELYLQDCRIAQLESEIGSFHELFYLQDKQTKELSAALSKADDFAVGITAFVQSLQAKVIELNASVEDLMAGGVATAQQAPVITDRFMHKQTAKGWRLDESSLTIDWKGAVPDSATRARLLRESYADGLAEAELRNREPEVLALS